MLLAALKFFLKRLFFLEKMEVNILKKKMSHYECKCLFEMWNANKEEEE